jgi:hypothetical protein
MNHRLPPIEPHLEELLRAESRFPPESAEREDRVFAAVRTHLGTGTGTGGPPDEGGAAPRTAAYPRLRLPAIASWLGGAMIGATLGSAITLALVSGAPRTMPPTAKDAIPAELEHEVVSAAAEVDAPLEQPPAPAVHEAEPLPDPVAPAPVGPEPRARIDRTSDEAALAPAATDPAQTLRDEQRIIEAARAALAERSYDAALEALARHRARFAGGALAEERDALIVRALAASGRLERARAAAAAFERDHPESFYRRTLERALAP